MCRAHGSAKEPQCFLHRHDKKNELFTNSRFEVWLAHGIVLSIVLAILYSHLSEWVLHKYVLHGLGKIKGGPWSSHWHTHHRSSRQNDNYDSDYIRSFLDPAVREEVLGLALLSLLHLPLVLINPIFYITLVLCSIRYYRIHKKSHLDVELCKKHLPWHYDHHMGQNQDANWGVTTDWVDRLMGTRIKY